MFNGHRSESSGGGALEASDSCDGFIRDLLVVELGDRIGVGACGGLLAQLGAEVVLVEDVAERADRKWRSRPAASARKHSIVVDWSSSEDRSVLDRLMARADVILTSSDVSARDQAVWDGDRPEWQIVCDVTAFGHSGPMAGVPFSEPLIQAFAGVADTTGRADGPPLCSGFAALEMETAAYAASAILAALRARRASGSGQLIDMALFDTGVNALAAFIPLALAGLPMTRKGNRHPTSSPWNSYRARDGWVTICAPTNDQWKRLCTVINRPELVDDERTRTTAGRLINVDVVDDAISEWTNARTVTECLERLQETMLPSGPIVDLAELGAEANLQYRQVIAEVSDPETHRAAHVAGQLLRASDVHATPPVVPGRDSYRSRVEDVGPPPTSPTHPPPSSDKPVRPLAGIRVVEIGMNTVGPLAGRQLGALGADVIKVEPPTGDANRVNAPLRDDGESFIFAISNADKRGLVLDLRSAADAETLWRLLATADVVIENLKPGSLGRLGFDAETVRGRFPSIIYCSVNGFGHQSAYPDRPALDTVVQAMSGIMSSTLDSGVPTKTGISISDQLGGQFGLLGVLAGLEQKDRTGHGCTLDLAMQDSSAWVTHFEWDRTAGPTSGAALEVLDGFIMIDAQDVTEDQLSTLGDALISMTREQAVQHCHKEHDLTAAPVLSVQEAIDHPQCEARALTVNRPTPLGDTWLLLGSPLRLLSTPPRVSTAMPPLGWLDPALSEELGIGNAHMNEHERQRADA